jgi:hypothetical protein
MPGRCLEAYHLHRTRLELIAERKVRRRQLTDDGNVEITGRDCVNEKFMRVIHARPAIAEPFHESRATSRSEAERGFFVRVRIGIPPKGLGDRLDQIIASLDANSGSDRWASTASSTRGVVNDALAIYFADVTLAGACMALMRGVEDRDCRWGVSGPR